MRRGRIFATLLLMALVVGKARAGDAPPVAPPARPAAPPKQELPRQRIELGHGVSFEMVLIPAGEFDMGSPETEEGRLEDEALHRVRISTPFWLACTEVTQAAWDVVMRDEASTAKEPRLPVTYVSWHDGQEFLARLNERVKGGGFRLPMEAEWEYACRAGSRTRYGFGDDEKALVEHDWFESNSGGAAHPVATLRANGWGLHDMHGNVMEWCADRYGPDAEAVEGVAIDPAGTPGSGRRVFRGGCWNWSGRHARSAARHAMPAAGGMALLGFRPARTPGTDAPPTPAPGMAPPALPPGPAPKPGGPSPPVVPSAKGGDVPSWAKVAPEQVDAAKKAGVPVAFENSIGMRFVLIPAGTFTMGSPETEAGRDSGEAQHEVTVSRPHYLGVTEVTNRQYRLWKADHDSGQDWPGGFSLNGDGQPVVRVSWDEATAFARWLAEREGVRTYRLPTEAEWEHSCRAETRGRWYWGEAEEAMGRHENVPDRTARSGIREVRLGEWPKDWPPRFLDTDDGRVVAAPVASYLSNPWGLHDMLGNVSEWCSDLRTLPVMDVLPQPARSDPIPMRAVRGGAWDCVPWEVRAAARSSQRHDLRSGAIGFRLAASVREK